MADNSFLTAAQQETANQKRALLAAMTQEGSRAKAAYDAQLADQQATRKAQLDAMLQQSATRSIPATAQQRVTQLGGEGTGLRTAALQDAETAHGRLMEGISAANASYMDQASAAAPLIAQIAQARKAQADQAAAASAAKADPLGLNALGGQSAAKLQLGGMASILQDAARSNAQIARNSVGPNPSGKTIGFTGGRAYQEYLDSQDAVSGRSKESVARDLAIANGVDPSVAAGMFPEPKAKAAKPAPFKPTSLASVTQFLGISAGDVSKLKSMATTTPNGDQVTPYTVAVSQAQQAAKSGMTRAEFDAEMKRQFVANIGHDYPKLRALVMAEYGGLFAA